MGVDLGRFDATTFEDLAGTLAVAEFGASVHPMGSGKDGGRDLICHDPIRWTTPDDPATEHTANGYTVLQVKHKADLGSHDTNRSWLWGQVRDELHKWATKPERNRVPKTLIFVTNVPLTPAPESGSFDTLHDNIRAYISRARRQAADERDDDVRMVRRAEANRLAKIEHFHFWDYHQINALVQAHQDVRWAYNAFLTAGDVLSMIPALLGAVTENELEPALRSHARTTLVSGGRIYFDEAGATSDAGMPVQQVMVDLPVLVPGRQTADDESTRLATALPYLFDRSGRVLRPKTTRVQKPRHIIITGAAGNGKTTLSKMLVQAHRAAFLRDSTALSEEQQAVIDETDQALRDMSIAPPVYPRWPIQVNLAEYAQEGAVDLETTLIRRIAHEVSLKSDVGNITPNLLDRWRTKWPWLVVLDGFDEVVDPTLRKRIIEQIDEFAGNCEADDSDTLIVLTTRPLGFTEEIGNGLFERIQLTDLTPSAALAYGEKVTAVRLAKGPERRDQVIRRLREAAADEAYANLLRTPLQVLILSIIVEQAGELSPDRYSLFHGYFTTVMTREKSKPGGFSRLIRDHAALIEQIHHRVGIELQVRTEHARTTLPIVSPQELHDIIWLALKEEEYDPESHDRQLLENIKNAATHRLVLLAPHGDEGYGFDVRLLQEYMAGQYLATASDTVVEERMRLTAVSPHWRQTWLLAAGKMFAQPTTYLQQMIVSITETIDDDAPERLGRTFPVGPGLAFDILNDGMARARPRWLKRLVSRALDALENDVAIPNRFAGEYADTLVRLATINESVGATIADEVRERMHPTRRPAGLVAVLRQWPSACDIVKAPSRVKAIGRVTPAPGAPPVQRISRTPPGLEELTREQRSLFARAMPRQGWTQAELGATTAGLRDPDVAKAIEAHLPALLRTEPRMARALESRVISRIQRHRIGERLLPSE